MNEREVSELRRRFRADKSSITHIRGCCVNDQHEIISQFNQSLGLLDADDTELIFSTLRKTLSGGIGKHLNNLVFSTKQVADSDEHRLLMALRESGLSDEKTVQVFFQKVIASLEWEGSYLILLVRDTYDVPYHSKDGQRQADAGNSAFSYILCSICPIKLTKPALSYQVNQHAFGHLPVNWVVGPPETGFLFPAFDDRATNLYGALYYSRSTAENQDALIDTLFKVEPPIPADTQKETFQAILAESLSEECDLELVQTVQDELSSRIEAYQDAEEPLAFSSGELQQVLTACGVSQKHVDTFEARYAAEFGEKTEVNPQNLMDFKQIAVTTPEVTIHVSPEHRDLIQTRVIDGVPYLLVRAGEDVEVNGVRIQIADETQPARPV